jgi:tetratricopeptide (TPR) repeat protein
MSEEATRNLALAAHFLVIERPNRAQEVLHKATAAERETGRYWRLLTESYYQQAQYERAREAALSGLAIYSEDIGLLRQLASACRQLQVYNVAEAALQNARNQQPNNPNLLFDSAYLALHAGDFDSAEKMLAHGRQLAPDAPHILRIEALIARGRKQWAVAEIHVRAWLAHDAQNSSAHYLLAEILARLNRDLESKESLQRAVQLDASSGAAEDLRRVERRQSGCVGALLLLAIGGGVMLGAVGLMAYLVEDFVGGLIMVLLALPLTGLLAYFLIAGRRSIQLQEYAVVLGSGEREQRIAYDEILELRNGQLGILVRTAQRRYLLYRIDQKQQAQLFVDLRNRVPQAYGQLLNELQKPLPMTVWGNWHTLLAMLALFSVGVVILYALYYNFVISRNRDWGITIFMGLSALFVVVLAVWRVTELPVWMRFSADEIHVRYPLKTVRYQADRLAHVGLRRGYRIFKGRQLADYKVELHFADGEVLRLGEGEIRHPPDDWSPLYVCAARLQVQYGVTAPRHEPGQIGRYVV